MIHSIAKNILYYMSNESIHNNTIEKATYTLEVILTDLSKFMILLIFFSFFSYQTEFFICFLFSTILRINLGGYHINSYIKCLVFTIGYTTLIIALSLYVPLSKTVVLLFGIILVLIIFVLAPVLTGPRINFSKKQYQFFHLSSVTISLIYLLVALISDHHFSMYGFWIITIQLTHILFMKGKYYVKKTQLFSFIGNRP